MSKKNVEAALFVAKNPLTIEEISKMLKEDEKVIMRWIFELKDEYKNRGMIIKQIAGGFEMVSSPECIDIVQKIVPKEYETLSPSSFETLAIIAYNQPTKRSTIAKLRGVLNPDHGLSSLIDRHLIIETEDGYITTDEFLHFFAINDLKELPEIIVEDLTAEGDESEESNLLTTEKEKIEKTNKHDVSDMPLIDYVDSLKEDEA